MFDQRLQPLTDRYGTSHGLPSLETHMATVVTGWWAESAAGGGQQQPLAWVVAVGYVFFVGFTRRVARIVIFYTAKIFLFGKWVPNAECPLSIALYFPYSSRHRSALMKKTGQHPHSQTSQIKNASIRWPIVGRVYACSRFVHQVALSCVSGYAGLALGWRLSLHLDGLGILIKHHFFGTAAVVVIAVRVVQVEISTCNGKRTVFKVQSLPSIRFVAVNLIEHSTGCRLKESLPGSMAIWRGGRGGAYCLFVIGLRMCVWIWPPYE